MNKNVFAPFSGRIHCPLDSVESRPIRLPVARRQTMFEFLYVYLLYRHVAENLPVEYLSVVINERFERFIVFNITNLLLFFSSLNPVYNIPHLTLYKPTHHEISEKKKIVVLNCTTGRIVRSWNGIYGKKKKKVTSVLPPPQK